MQKSASGPLSGAVSSCHWCSIRVGCENRDKLLEAHGSDDVLEVLNPAPTLRISWMSSDKGDEGHCMVSGISIRLRSLKLTLQPV